MDFYAIFKFFKHKTSDCTQSSCMSKITDYIQSKLIDGFSVSSTLKNGMRLLKNFCSM